MTPTQTDWLNDELGPIVGQHAAEPLAPELLPLSSSERATALAHIATGEVRAVTQLSLNPARVRVWPGNARSYDRLSENNCRELIDSIVAEGGQKVPAVLRQITNDPSYEYEVIAGTRRHFSISWLRANNYPDMMFNGVVHALDDEAAFRLADFENRARKDVSDIERARNYAAALTSYYGGRQARMAECLRISKGWLSKMLNVATIPDAVLAAFDDEAAVSLAALYPVAARLSEADAAGAIAKEAATIVAEQASRRRIGQDAIATSEVIGRLKSAGLPPRQRSQPYEVESRQGRAMLSVKASNRSGVNLHLHGGSGAQREEVVQAVARALEWLEAHGKGLQP